MSTKNPGNVSAVRKTIDKVLREFLPSVCFEDTVWLQKFVSVSWSRSQSHSTACGVSRGFVSHHLLAINFSPSIQQAQVSLSLKGWQALESLAYDSLPEALDHEDGDEFILKFHQIKGGFEGFKFRLSQALSEYGMQEAPPRPDGTIRWVGSASRPEKRNRLSSSLLQKISTPDYGMPIRKALTASLVKDIEEVFQGQFEGGSPQWKTSNGKHGVYLLGGGIIVLNSYRSGWNHDGFPQHFVCVSFRVLEEQTSLVEQVKTRFEEHTRESPGGAAEFQCYKVTPLPDTPVPVLIEFSADIRPNLYSLTDRQILLRQKRNQE